MLHFGIPQQFTPDVYNSCDFLLLEFRFIYFCTCYGARCFASETTA
jgi:hypothetical protein